MNSNEDTSKKFNMLKTCNYLGRIRSHDIVKKRIVILNLSLTPTVILYDNIYSEHMTMD